jgi:hypothetical protein
MRRVARPGAGTCRIHGSRTIVAEHATLAGRTPVASFVRYADAERTLDLLANTRFPVDRLALIGGDLKLVDDTTGRITAVRAVAWGAGGGAWLGALMALFTFVLDRPLAGELAGRLSWGMLLGTLFGVPLSVTAYAALGRTRDATSRRRVVAARYELYADGDVAASAWRLLFNLHPTGLTLVDQVPVEVVSLPTGMTLVETLDATGGQPGERPDGPSADPARPSPGPSPEPSPEPPAEQPAHADVA